MEKETQTFKVFKLEPYNPIANPLVIITIKNNPHLCRSEYFVLIQPNYLTETIEDIAKQPQRLSFQKTGIGIVNPELFIDDVEEYMTQQTKEIVESDLKIKLYDKSGKEGIIHEDWHQLKLVPTKKEDLLGLWMRGKCTKEIDKMRTDTRNKELREFLNKVVEAPIFEIKEI